MKIYIDGGCKGNGQAENIGGWGYIVIENKKPIHVQTEVSYNTTNNREELKGLIGALKYCIDNSIKTITIVTDSKYVKNGMTIWLGNWAKNNWQKNNWDTNLKEEVKNKDLWMEILELKQYLKKDKEKIIINFEWVKGHSGDKFNEMIDDLIDMNISKVIKQQLET